MEFIDSIKARIPDYAKDIRLNLDGTISLSGTAWNNATKAVEFSPGLKPIADQMQAIAKSLADEARALKANGGVPPAQ